MKTKLASTSSRVPNPPSALSASRPGSPQSGLRHLPLGCYGSAAGSRSRWPRGALRLPQQLAQMGAGFGGSRRPVSLKRSVKLMTSTASPGT